MTTSDHKEASCIALPNREYYDSHPELFHLDYDTLPKQSKKYWKQRYGLFSKFHEGVYMNAELWYSVTPESVAIFIAKFLKACDPEMSTILDVFCGGGGNTIQMARYFDKAIGIDLNGEHLYCTEQNAKIYDVADSVELHRGSWPDGIDDDLLKKLQRDVDFVFASPPWGGPAYKGKHEFDLSLLQPMPLKPLLESFFRVSPNVCLFLPRNSNLIQLSQITRDLCGDEAKCRVIYVYSDGFVKGIYALWGGKFMPPSNQEIPHGEDVEREDGEDVKVYERGEYGRGYQDGFKDGYYAALIALQGGSLEETQLNIEHHGCALNGEEQITSEATIYGQHQTASKGLFGDRYANEAGGVVDYGELDY